MNKRVLIIAYHYPPVRVSSGIQRTLKFSQYLREFGWEPMILSVQPKAYEVVSGDQLKEIPEGIVVERAFGLDTARHLSLAGKYFRWMAQPDRWVSWWPGGVMTGLKMIKRYRPQAIMSTVPIASAHLIGMSLQRLSGLPWVADFRDSMTEPGYPRDPMTWKVHRWIEQATVRNCAKAVFTTEPSRQMYADRYPEMPTTHWEVIENGYDEENFQDAETALVVSPPGADTAVTLLHSGVLYPKERDPRPFFAAIRRLKEEGTITSATLQVVLRATGSDGLYQPMLQEFGIADVVRLEPVIAYRDALNEMLRADGLLLFQGRVCNHQVPAKLYEYYRSGRPIVALTDPEGVTERLLRDAGATCFANMAVEGEIVEALRAFLHEVRAGRALGIARNIAAQHSRRSRTAQLASLLDRLTLEPKAASASSSVPVH